MRWKNTVDRYSSLSIGMHWLMVLLLIAVYAAINLQDLAAKGSALRADLKLWHFVFGLTILVLVTARLVLRWQAGRAPIIVPTISVWQHRLAQAMHVSLYLFMIVMPLLGWLTVSAKGAPITIFGMQLPLLLASDKALAGTLKEIHETIGTIGYYLIGLHALAALYHHYVKRDNTLARMLPKCCGRKKNRCA